MPFFEQVKQSVIRFASFVFCVAGHVIYKIFKSGRRFTFQGKSYTYFYHTHNYTWRSERVVEIPIVWEAFMQNTDRSILEVGNVLSHYFDVNHDIVDKYEKGHGVINTDIVDFRSNKKFSLIVSISTLEHVGWDETPRQPLKILEAIRNLKRNLAPKGKILVTLPVGYNPEVDKLLKDNKLGFTSRFYLKRISKDNLWRQVGWEDIKNAKFSSPFRFANGLVIGVIENKDNA